MMSWHHTVAVGQPLSETTDLYVYAYVFSKACINQNIHSLFCYTLVSLFWISAYTYSQYYVWLIEIKPIQIIHTTNSSETHDMPIHHVL